MCVAGAVIYHVANGVALKTGTLNVILLFNTYLTLSCLYIPKLYAIFTDSEEANKNWRTGSFLSDNNFGMGLSRVIFTTGVATIPTESVQNIRPKASTMMNDLRV